MTLATRIFVGNALARIALAGGAAAAAACGDPLDIEGVGASLQALGEVEVNVAPCGEATLSPGDSLGLASNAIDEDLATYVRLGGSGALTLNLPAALSGDIVVCGKAEEAPVNLGGSTQMFTWLALGKDPRCDGVAAYVPFPPWPEGEVWNQIRIGGTEAGIEIREVQFWMESQGCPSSGAPDAGVRDVPDAGVPGVPDAGVPGVPDAGVPGPPDAGVPGVPDAAVLDPLDASTPDAGCSGTADYDLDGVGDICDTCPYVYNPAQGACPDPGPSPDGGGNGVPDAGRGEGEAGGGGCSAGGSLPGWPMAVALAMFAAARRRTRRRGRGERGRRLAVACIEPARRDVPSRRSLPEGRSSHARLAR
jgi:hypothetical protein